MARRYGRPSPQYRYEHYDPTLVTRLCGSGFRYARGA